MASFWLSGAIVFGIVVVTTNLKILLFSNTHNFITLFCIFGSIAFYILTFAIASGVAPTITSYNLIGKIFSSPYFYLLTILQITLTTMFDGAISRYSHFLKQEKEGGYTIMVESPEMGRSLDMKRDPTKDFQRRYTGYGFSQEEPIGEFQKKFYQN